MRYRVTHHTEYSYGERVPLCHNVIRLRPRDTAFQTCATHELTISPLPADRREHVDFFGNHVTWVAIQEPHNRLKVSTISEIDVIPGNAPADPKSSAWQSPAWDQVKNSVANRRDPDGLAAQEYSFDSPYVMRGPELAEFARPSFPPGAPLLPAILNLTNRIFHEFTFDTGATTIGTPILEVLHHRHGVCQDFAHLQIGCLRSLGLPARYVSGYVVTKPPPGQPRLMGADASHAWISAYVPDHGWIDFDPTNGLIPNGEHITIAWARDYDDLSPVKGVITGGHRHSLNFSVDIEPIASPAKSETDGNKQPKTEV